MCVCVHLCVGVFVGVSVWVCAGVYVCLGRWVIGWVGVHSIDPKYWTNFNEILNS